MVLEDPDGNRFCVIDAGWRTPSDGRSDHPPRAHQLAHRRRRASGSGTPPAGGGLAHRHHGGPAPDARRGGRGRRPRWRAGHARDRPARPPQPRRPGQRRRAHRRERVRPRRRRRRVQHLYAAGVGWPMGEPGEVVPIVPAAVLFDLGRGGEFGNHPGPAEGRAACRGRPCRTGGPGVRRRRHGCAGRWAEGRRSARPARSSRTAPRSRPSSPSTPFGAPYDQRTGELLGGAPRAAATSSRTSGCRTAARAGGGARTRRRGIRGRSRSCPGWPPRSASSPRTRR